MLNDQQFLKRFFGEENRYSLEYINSGRDNQDSLKPWVKRLQEKKETVLPLFEGNRIIWYGITFSDEQFNRLGEDLGSFIGRTYSFFVPVRANPVEHPIDQAVNEFTDGKYFRFQGNNKSIFKQLEYMRSMWEVRPYIDKHQTMSVGRLLRMFYMTLQLGPSYRMKAENYLDDLQGRKLLNAINILFLRIKMLAEYEEWEEILSLRSFPDLINMRRPLAVTDALLQAIYNVELKKYENTIQHLVTTFENEVNPKYGSLITTGGSFKSPEALILLMLHAVTVRQDVSIVNSLKKVSTNEDTRSILENISRQLLVKEEEAEQPDVGMSGVDVAHNSILLGQFDYALSILKDLDASWNRAMLLFQCAYQLQSLEAREIALDAFHQLSKEERNSFINIRQNKEYLDEITEGNSTKETGIPNDWMSWFESLEHYSAMKNFHHASEGADEWTIEKLLDPTYPMDTFIEQLYSCYDDEHKKESLYISFP
ncbi:hypothetical protein V7147_15255, partial [Bacillus sp. JJ1521]|uniref:hypothetical protein n=1 Tax=Bacillus sp. JJ1521 TaxID=3122957 RepID=UPI002FFEF683